jgi:hypothetical protein
MKRKGRPGCSSEAASQVQQSNFRFRNRERPLRLEPRNRAGHAAQSVAPAASETVHQNLEQAPQETPVGLVIFADRLYRIRCAERMFAANDDIAAWRDERSSGLSSGSLTFHDGSIRRLESNARMVLSPSPSGPMPEARKSLPSCPNARPRGNGTTWS